MLLPQSWQHICTSSDELPDFAIGSLDEHVLNHLGGSLADLFPAFASAFPKCAAAFDATWKRPVLALKEVSQTCIAKVILEHPEVNAIFPLRGSFCSKSGPDFELEKAMLPTQWKELYRSFDSFGLTQDANAR